MNWIDEAIEISEQTLHKLYDQENGGYYYGFNDVLNKIKIIRYNARIIMLLNWNYLIPLFDTTKYMISELQLPDGNVYYSSRKNGYGTPGDVSLLVSALSRMNFQNEANLSREWLKTVTLDSVKDTDSAQIIWFLHNCNNKEIENYLFHDKKLTNKFIFFNNFGIKYYDFPTLTYAIRYLLSVDKNEEALRLYHFLKEKLFGEKGEWKLSYFPSVNWVYSKLFSVHQLGMAPLYLLELYEKVGEEDILNTVLKGVEFGKRFVGKDRIYRNLNNHETRCYECVFDYIGLRKVREYV